MDQPKFTTSMIFFFGLIAELNRTPFDLSEGKSELFSGFYEEYRRGGFVLIFYQNMQEFYL